MPDRYRRPLLDRLELRFTKLFRVITRIAMRTPRAPLHERMVKDAIERAARAFNRGDMEVIFSGFANDARYVPPAPLGGPSEIVGREAVLRYWRRTLAEWDSSWIDNVSIELRPNLIVREARLRHTSERRKRTLSYRIRQHTHLRRGQIVEQTNELLHDS